jgi:hypothetical protein
MKKVMLFGILIFVTLLVSGQGCELSKIGKTCTQECIREESYCASTRQECVEKNFWGNCIEFENVCARYDTRCAQYGEVCR